VSEPVYDAFCDELTRLGATVARGVFGADMQVALVNDGPVTMVLESP
jgi:D-tyrosyl-tRNA(Tyr) deacylase